MEEKIKKFIASSLKNKQLDIFLSNGRVSPSKLVKYIESELKIEITRQTVAKYLNEDLTKYKKLVDFSKNKDMMEIKDAIDVAWTIANDESAKMADRTKALNAWRQLKQQYIEHEQHLREIELRKVEASKPNYLIKFEPGCAERTCPKCGHKFYDNMKNEKEPFFKAGNGQSTLYEEVKE